MDQLLETIRAAVADGATEEAKATGANACRAVLAALEAKPGEPLAAAPSTPSPATGVPDVGALIAGLKGVPLEQLLDLAIARLKTALPAETKLEPVRRLAVPLVPLPKVGRRA